MTAVRDFEPQSNGEIGFAVYAAQVAYIGYNCERVWATEVDEYCNLEW